MEKLVPEWYQNEVDEEIKDRVGSTDKMKHNERSDQWFLESGVEQEWRGVV